MKKASFLWAVILIFMIVLTGCGGVQNEYSNLTDLDSQKEVSAVLKDHGVTDAQVDTLLKWINDFNKIVISPELPEGFSALPEEGVDYSMVMMDDAAEEYTYLQWLNCRLTAFQLVKNQIHTAQTGNEADLWLMFDLEAIGTLLQYRLTEEERADFVTLFNQISVAETTTIEDHEAKIQEAWEERKIELNAEGLSLICVYLHSPEDQVRFVGHVGVLAETADGLLFVEKWGPMAPFQATRFVNRESLRKYLLSRADLYGDETELAPIVIENGMPIK